MSDADSEMRPTLTAEVDGGMHPASPTARVHMNDMLPRSIVADSASIVTAVNNIVYEAIFGPLKKETTDDEAWRCLPEAAKFMGSKKLLTAATQSHNETAWRRRIGRL